MRVADILRVKGSEVTTTRRDTPILEAAQTLARLNIGALVVVEADETLCGVVSERDIMRAWAERREALESQTVSSLMSVNVETCLPTDGVDSVMQRMTHGRFRHLPVVEGGRLVGIVSIGDIVKNRIEELEHDAAMLQNYIAG